MIGILAKILAEQALIQIHNEEKIQQAIDKYWDACKYPRKIKKRMRKEATKDYNFWMSLKEFYNNPY